MRRKLLTASQINDAIRSLKEWWARSQLVSVLSPDQIGILSFEDLLNAKLQDQVSDVAIVASVRIATEGLRVRVPLASINSLASQVLTELGYCT
jgi:hypothetical protein